MSFKFQKVKERVLKKILSFHHDKNGLLFIVDLVTRDTQDVIFRAPKSFQSPVHVDSVSIVGALVNGRNMSDVVTLDGDQRIDGAVVLERGLVVDGDLSVSHVGGIDYDAMLRHGVHPELLRVGRIGTDRHVTFYGLVNVSGTLSVGSEVNGVDLKAAVADVLYSDERDPVITGNKRLQSFDTADLIVSKYMILLEPFLKTYLVFCLFAMFFFFCCESIFNITSIR